MPIELFEAKLDDGKTSISLGVRILRERGGKPTAHMFSIAENQGGTLIGDRLWGVTQAILDEKLFGYSHDDVKWTFTERERTTNMTFSTLNDAPYMLHVEDTHALDLERTLRDGKFTLETYATKYEGLPPDYTALPVRERRYPDVPKTLYCVPCAAAKDGVFYCAPSYLNTDHMRDDYEFIVADTAKLLAALQKDDSRMIDHASQKFNGSAAQSWIPKSLDSARDMGLWSMTSGRGLTMASGQAALIEAARQLDLPFYPLAIERAHGAQKIRDVIAAVGYSPAYPAAGTDPRGYAKPRPL